MNRLQFFFLYANVNSIAELALRQAGERVLERPRPSAPSAALTQDELDAQVLASFENLDFSAMEGLNVPRFRGIGVPVESEDVARDSDPFDLERYLDRAYAAQDQLRERLDAHLARVDLDAVRSALGRLPFDLPLLTEPLSANEMVRWLKRYEAGDAALSELVVMVRQLDLSV
jgi:hypothetical protein